MNSRQALEHSRAGFTLVEVLIVLGMLATLATIGLAISIPFLRVQTVSAAADTVEAQLASAQFASYAQADDAFHGIAVLPGEVVHFEGPSYAQRDPTRDVSYNIASQITASGQTEIVFQKGALYPSSPSTIALELAGRTLEVSISTYGKIDVQKGSE